MQSTAFDLELPLDAGADGEENAGGWREFHTWIGRQNDRRFLGVRCEAELAGGKVLTAAAVAHVYHSVHHLNV
jgi:hypothetical protein